MNSHTFSYRTETHTFDILKINLDAPEGTSIFQTSQEREMAEQNYMKLMHKYENQIYRLKETPQCRSTIEEQEPIQN